MKLASLKTGGRDGTLVVVDRAIKRAAAVPAIAPTLQSAIERWDIVAPTLAQTYEALNRDAVQSFALDTSALAAPLPRAYQWLDASAYLTHVERVRKARGSTLPDALRTDPLMYQGVSDGFLGPCDDILVTDIDSGVDFEAEVAVVTDDVPMGTDVSAAATHIKLLLLVNDVSLRRLIPAELAKGFGFVQGKPACTLSPVAVTPDETGAAWDGTKLHAPLRTHVNGALFGDPDAGDDMQFDFPTLIAHACKTRRLGAGTIVGSGTVSNVDLSRGFSCLIERRVVEQIETGESQTPFLCHGDQVRIEMHDADGTSIFGAIDQKVRALPKPVRPGHT